MFGCVLGIATQLVVINSNRRLSRIVINLMELLHRSNWAMEGDGYVEHGNVTLVMVIIVMLTNCTSHVWHRFVANLEMNRYN